jgi:hypothetical protein
VPGPRFLCLAIPRGLPSDFFVPADNLWADPDAFMVINPSHEVLGEGFKPLTRVVRG